MCSNLFPVRQQSAQPHVCTVFSSTQAGQKPGPCLTSALHQLLVLGLHKRLPFPNTKSAVNNQLIIDNDNMTTDLLWEVIIGHIIQFFSDYALLN